MKTVIAIVDEPRGDVYRALLAYARRRSGLFSLVWQDGLCRDETRVADRLRSAIVSETRVSEWPGTRLMHHAATLVTYQICDTSVRVLDEVRGLYDWEAPTRPEDLALYDANGQAWLGSTAHERDAFVDENVVDPSELTDNVPGLRLGGIRS
jgi:hypothetical protein